MSDRKPILVIGPFPPTSGGSSVIMRNLLAQFEAAAFPIITFINVTQIALERPRHHDVRHALEIPRIPGRLVRYWMHWQLPNAVKRTVRWVEELRPCAILGVYPDFEYLHVARETANITGLPLIAYLHDTITESLSRTHLAGAGAKLQEQVFSEAKRILVMSQGMADMYAIKYGLDTYPLVHSYPDVIPSELEDRADIKRNLFFGGNVYSINQNSVKRAIDAARSMNMRTYLATATSQKVLERSGITGEHVEKGFYSNRAAYLGVMQQQQVLLLALDWEDESPVHSDELGTIFPTKTPEFLASGRPILVHCPEHYFLARFFREYQCGLLVTERSEERLIEALWTLQADSGEVQAMRAAALKAAQQFNATSVKQTFEHHLQIALAENAQ